MPPDCESQVLVRVYEMQSAIERLPAGQIPDDHLAHIAPVAFRHINMNGKIRFMFDDYASFSGIGPKRATTM